MTIDRRGVLAAALCALLALPGTAALAQNARGKLVYFMSIDEAKFRKPVVPGDQLRIHCVKERSRGNIWKFRAEAKVDGKARYVVAPSLDGMVPSSG